MSGYDDDIEFFEETETREASPRPRRRGPREPRRPLAAQPVGLTRLAGLVALAIAVIVVLVLWVGACQGQSRHDEYASYLQDVGTIAQSSARVGNEFAAQLGAQGLKLADLETRLEQWSQQQQQLYDQAQQLRPPGPLIAAQQQVLDTLQLRAMALAGLANSLAQTKGKDSGAVADDLARQAQLLSASDIVWAELYRLPVTQTLKTLGITGVVVPASQFVTNPDVISVRSFTIVYQRLQPASTGGTPTGLHGSELVSTKAVGGNRTVELSPSQPTTVYVSAGLELQVTVEDSGKFNEVNIPVTVTVKVGGSTIFRKKQLITGMQPNDQETVSFKNLQLTPDAFGATASLRVDVGAVPGETTLSNNTATYPVLFRLSQP